jgi:hypothetical protein
MIADLLLVLGIHPAFSLAIAMCLVSPERRKPSPMRAWS